MHWIKVQILSSQRRTKELSSTDSHSVTAVYAFLQSLSQYQSLKSFILIQAVFGQPPASIFHVVFVELKISQNDSTDYK